MSKEIPWFKLLKETFQFFKDFNLHFALFAGALFLLAIPGQWQLLETDWMTLQPLQLWIWISEILLFFAGSYFVFVAFVLWIKNRVAHAPPTDFMSFFKDSLRLMIPLGVLSMRGAVLSLFGIFALILPGIYFSCKYELASYCVILEGWDDRFSPITRAEQLIAKYRWTFGALAGIMFLDWMSTFIIELFIKTMEIQTDISIKLGIAAIETALALFFDVYLALTVLFILKKTPPPDGKNLEPQR